MTYAYFLIAFLHFIECGIKLRKGNLNLITLLVGFTYIGIGCCYDPLATILLNLFTSFNFAYIADVVSKIYVY